jgi:hypothetical protein
MVRFGAFPQVLAAALAAVLCIPLAGQASSDQVPDAAFKSKLVPPPVEAKPFAESAPNRRLESSIEFRQADQMSEKDRLLVADAESSISEHAGFVGLEFNKSNWSYQQIVCPALPNHVFLQYMRNNGAGDVSVFSASIPRDGEGRVRIIPILRRGYSLFSPAPINALTISAFNHIRAEETSDKSLNWLGNALCYAALAGAHPQLTPLDAEPALHKPVPALTAMMDVRVLERDEEVIRFADAAALPRPMEWTMTFTRAGRLIKATHAPVPMETVRPLSQASAVTSTRPAPQ